MSPKHTIALWALGRIYSGQLPRIALQWLELGLDSPTLRILAGETNPIMSDVGPMFETVLEELNFSVPSSGEAVARLVSEIAQKIVDGSVSPYQGAVDIEQLSYDYAEWEQEDFDGRFEPLTMEYEEFGYEIHREWSEEQRQQIKAELDEKIIEEARKLIVADDLMDSLSHPQLARDISHVLRRSMAFGRGWCSFT